MPCCHRRFQHRRLQHRRLQRHRCQRRRQRRRREPACRTGAGATVQPAAPPHPQRCGGRRRGAGWLLRSRRLGVHARPGGEGRPLTRRGATPTVRRACGDRRRAWRGACCTRRPPKRSSHSARAPPPCSAPPRHSQRAAAAAAATRVRHPRPSKKHRKPKTKLQRPREGLEVGSWFPCAPQLLPSVSPPRHSGRCSLKPTAHPPPPPPVR